MKISILSVVALFGCLSGACSRSTPGYASSASLKSQFPDQFARIEFYTQNFTKLINSVPFPPEGAEERDKELFQIPSVLNLRLYNETTHAGMELKSWSRQPLNSRSFWMPPDDKKLPRVAIGKGSVGGAQEFEILEYTDVMLERGTGNKIRFTIDFDLAELKKHAEQD